MENPYLVLLDADSTLFNEEVIDLLAAKAGYAKEVSAVTERAMAGELDFKEALVKRVSYLAGLSILDLKQVQSEVTITKGGAQLISELKLRGHIVAVISGGFSEILDPIMSQLNIEFWSANTLEIKEGTLTGKVIGQIVDREAKAQYLLALANKHGIPIERTIAIGDGANDIDMVQSAGLGIAFCAKESLKRVAQVTIDQRDLSAVLKYIS